MNTELMPISLQEAFKKGPSSLIAGQVIESIEKLKQDNIQPKVWHLLLNPVAGFKALQAMVGETSAQANAKRLIAQTVNVQVQIAGQDIKRDTLLAYTHSLQENLGEMLPGFCQDHGVNPPRPGSVAEMIQLIKLNYQIVTVNEYQFKLQEAMQTVIKRQAQLESKKMLAHVNNQELPTLIQERDTSYPLQRKLIYQNAAQVGSLVTGIPAALATGAVVGIFGGGLIGGHEAKEFISKKYNQAKLALKNKLSS